MRLLEYRGSKFRFKEFARDVPRYAILSHTWGPDAEEITYRDVIDGRGKRKKGYKKLWFCAKQAKRDHLRYFWVDTCCIDRANYTELTTAINSMFRWYQQAARCYVYLSDISASGEDEDSQQSTPVWEPAFLAHRWFTRGWTLQELIAPASVEFFAENGRRLGDKRSLEQQIHEITGIARIALRGDKLAEFTVADRFKWAETRITTKEEDWAYSLLGIFSVSMPLIYGEGKAEAVRRLKKEIAEAENPRPLEASRRTWMVPFERNRSFTSRESELTRLRQALFTGQQTAKFAVTGLGGVGKTQLALELVYRMREEDENCSVFWMPATSRGALGQAYLDASRKLAIPGWDDAKADPKKLVQDYLSSEGAGRWLLVFDNADDLDMWLDRPTSGSGRLLDYLPKSPSGSIVFTTRDKKAAIALARHNVVELSEPDEASGRLLLRNYLINKDLVDSGNGDGVAALLDWLTYLPLAVVQAATYINENDIGLADYLSLLEEQEEDVIDLLSEDFEDDGRYHDTKNPVATTWLISFAQIRQRDPLAAEYLSLMACVDAKAIPRSFLPEGPSRKKATDALGTLQGYSFIAKGAADSAITIHRLVHLATRNWLRKEGLLDSSVDRAIKRLAEVFSGADTNNRSVWRPFMPHAFYTLESGLGTKDSDDTLRLLYKYGFCLTEDGQYNEAEAIMRRQMEIYMTKYEADHPGSLSSMANLGMVLWNQGRLEEAEKLEVQVMEIRKAKFGTDHPDTQSSMANFAATLLERGRLEEAEKLGVEVVELRTTKLGTDHPDTAISMGILSLAIYAQGRLEEAEKLQAQVMNIHRVMLGAEHPNTLTAMNNLAVTLEKQGRLEDAEKLLLQVIETRKTKLGADHDRTLRSMANLAMVWKALGRHGDAMSLMEACAQGRQRVLGPEHPDTLWSTQTMDEWRCESVSLLEQ